MPDELDATATPDNGAPALPDIDLSELGESYGEDFGDTPAAADDDPGANEDTPDAQPQVYDTRIYDDAGNVIGGSVYDSLDKLLEGAKEKDRTISKWKPLVQEWQKQQFSRKPSPKAEDYREQAAPAVEVSDLPQAIVDVLGDDGAKEFVEWFERRTQRAVDTQAPAAVQKVQAVLKTQQELDTLAQANPELLIPVADALAALNDPTDPNYDKAVALDQVYRLTEHFGTAERAFKAWQAGYGRAAAPAATTATPDATAIEAARKAGYEQARKELSQRNARPAGNYGDGALGKPTPDELLKMTPMQRYQHDMNLIKTVDLSELDNTG